MSGDRFQIADLERTGIDTVIIAGVDAQGRLFGKRMSPRVFAAKASEGIHVCTCVYAWDIAQSLEGLHVDFAGSHTGWHDFRLVPDLSTLRQAAWLDQTAICLADSADTNTGQLLPVAPRTILRGQVAALAERGLLANAATELEFYLYRGAPADLRTSGYRDMVPTTSVHADYNITEGNAMEPFFRGLRHALDNSDVPVDVAQVEYGHGQWEINLQYADPVEMADRHVLFKQATRDYAARYGYTATFMPRPATGDLGSSCHIHASLRTREGTSIFHNSSGERQVGEALLHAVGGTLTHAADLMCWYAPTINSYRRTNSQDFAGNGLTWGFDNRTVTVRVLAGSPSEARLEFRLPGADVNPYLALAGLLASASDGISQRTDPGPSQAGDAYATSASPALPATLIDAADAFSRSTFTATAFGKDVVSHYHALAQFEWNEFQHSVTDWERDRYLDVI